MIMQISSVLLYWEQAYVPGSLVPALYDDVLLAMNYDSEQSFHLTTVP